MPEGTHRILDSRSLSTGHRRLAELLRAGQAVLDVGCGTGAITRDIAAAVAPGGCVVGLDSNAALLEDARRRHGHLPGLFFTRASVHRLPFRAAFDLVNASRVLQWLADPRDALRAMMAATRPGGRVVALDYNHGKIAWEPAPPPSMQVFYAAFLRWRATAGMDNAIADHLAALCAEVGLADIVVTSQMEATRRDDPDFAVHMGLWAEVAATRGFQMVADGAITEPQRRAAETEWRAWLEKDALSQRLYLLSVEGTKPH